MIKKNTKTAPADHNENDYRKADALQWDDLDSDEIDDLMGLDFVDQIDFDL